MKAPNSDITQDPRWAHIVARDKTADGAFWYSVATTGIYCRPSCPSRPANPKRGFKRRAGHEPTHDRSGGAHEVLTFAVGQCSLGAILVNALALAIPCHRVVRHAGGLAGYRWGVERKRELIARESADREQARAA